MSIEVYNNAPVAYDATYRVLHDTTLTGQVYGYDQDGDAITAQLVTDAEYGTVTLDADGTFTYTPNTHFVGSDSFVFGWSGGVMASHVATVFIEVLNGPVLAAPGWDVSMIHSQSLTLDLKDATYDADQEELRFSLVSGPSYAREFELTSSGVIRYKPLERWVGVDSFVFKVSDGPSYAEGTVFISVHNHHPIAVDDGFEVQPYEPRILSVQELLANDYDVDNDQLRVMVDLRSVQHGQIWFDAEVGTITYVPDPGFVGIDSFLYWVTDDVAQGPLSPGVLDEFLPETENQLTTSNTGTVRLYVGVPGPTCGDEGGNSSQSDGGDGNGNGLPREQQRQPLETVDIVVYTFIPAYSVRVFNPLATSTSRLSCFQYFRGDNRGFTTRPDDYPAGEQRFRTYQRLRLEVYDDIKSRENLVLDRTGRVGETIEVDANDVELRRMTGVRGTHWRDDGDLSTYFSLGHREYVVNIEFSMWGRDPLIVGPPAPTIDYPARVQFTVDPRDRGKPLSEWRKHFWITCDGFPNYEAYIRFNNGAWRTIFRHDHKDQTPWSLFGSGEFVYKGYEIQWPLGNTGGGP